MKSIRVFPIAILSIIIFSCNRPEPNFEGVLMTDYGRNGIESFKTVTGAQGPLGLGSELYQVPMFEDKGDCEPVRVSAKDAGIFTIDPSYTYQAVRGKGPSIILSYKHLGTGDEFFNSIESSVLNKIVTNTFRDKARLYTTDSLMNNLGQFEADVELELKSKFSEKYFQLNTLTSGLTPPASMAKAIENRNNAVQQANQVKNQLETSKMLLEKARIDAQTNQVQSAGLTKEVLTQQWIEAIRNSKNKVIITDGKTPVIFQ
ncbi:SPFH domain-containing protein [Dyadobacter sp. LHD-138]|uniref:SPFH domain-containing protein n=1 Tax=Dyadobacter sp. LHD-138 TaxID=3071413 RepID=UPI0027E000D7|nr:SPFH domain-containing protein [Dyadobacter sp. LHD-138]MDQ6481605.1 SPFH domain-containing protein [Dyadobacter sp. LHD-138]